LENFVIPNGHLVYLMDILYVFGYFSMLYGNLVAQCKLVQRQLVQRQLVQRQLVQWQLVQRQVVLWQLISYGNSSHEPGRL
jgi:hypothetical protein